MSASVFKRQRRISIEGGHLRYIIFILIVLQVGYHAQVSAEGESLLILASRDLRRQTNDPQIPLQWTESLVIRSTDGGLAWELVVPKYKNKRGLDRSGLIAGDASLLVAAFTGLTSRQLEGGVEQAGDDDIGITFSVVLISREGARISMPLSIPDRRSFLEEGPLAEALSQVRPNARLNKTLHMSRLWAFDSSSLSRRAPRVQSKEE